MKRYPVILEREEDGRYSVHAPDLPGWANFGDTRSEGVANIREAVELWIETAREAGHDIPEPGTSVDYVSVAS